MSLKSLNQIIQRATLSEQYKTDEWREFSRNIRSQTNFCQVCKRAAGGAIKLNVHHYAYDPERMLWDYERDEVAVLCEDCHKQMHEKLQDFRQFVFCFFNPRSMNILNGALLAAHRAGHDPLKLAYAIAEMVASPRSIERFCQAWIDKPVEKRTTLAAPPQNPHPV